MPQMTAGYAASNPTISLETMDDAIVATSEDLRVQVEMVAEAIERLTGPLIRGSSLGARTTVTVSDRLTAAVFRAALARTAQHRPTDALIDVIVDQRR